MFHKILIPIDLQEEGFADQALQVAQAQMADKDAELHALSVVPGFGLALVAAYFPSGTQDKLRQESRTQLKALVDRLVPKQKVTLHLASGSPHEEILKLVRKQGIDLVVMHSHNRQALDRILLGSCASRVVEHAGCSVMVLRGL